MYAPAELFLPLAAPVSDAGAAPPRDPVARAIASGVRGLVIDRGEPDEVIALTHRARSGAASPVLLLLDVFRAARSGALVELPPPAALTSLRELDVVRRAARVAAHAARRLGCNALLAPPCDVAVGAGRTDLFGRDPTQVARAAAEWIDASQAEGVLCFATYFPGAGRLIVTRAPHGGSVSAVVPATEDQLYACDLVPFRAAIDGGAAGVVLSPASYPALDPSGSAAPRSPAVVQTLLRRQLRFEGLVVEDARFEHGARGAGAAAAALAAGVDLVLAPPALGDEVRAVSEAVAAGRLDAERVYGAARAREQWARFAAPPAAPVERVDRERHELAWVEEIAERAVCVVRGRLVRPMPPGEVTFVPSSGRVEHERSRAGASHFAAAMRPDLGDVRQVGAPTGARAPYVLMAEGGVPVGRGAGPRSEPGRDGAPREPVRTLRELAAVARRAARDVILVWCGHADDAPEVPEADLVIASWDASPLMQRAAARWLTRRT